jgi:hypothetical protein
LQKNVFLKKVPKTHKFLEKLQMFGIFKHILCIFTIFCLAADNFTNFGGPEWGGEGGIRIFLQGGWLGW